MNQLQAQRRARKWLRILGALPVWNFELMPWARATDRNATARTSL
jgi:hypothetical protein